MMQHHQLPNNLYKKLVAVSNEVKHALTKQGLAIPTENLDGSITIGYNTISKRSGFFVILDYSGDVLIDKINLPHTAILLANELALGKFLDSTLLQLDRKYGYFAFEESLHTHLAERLQISDPDRSDVMSAKSRVELQKKEYYKRQIMNRYEKLRRLV